MKFFLAIAILMTSTFALANDIGAYIRNDAIVSGVIKGVEKKFDAKCGPVTAEIKNGVVKAYILCMANEQDANGDDSEGAVSIEIDGEMYGEGRDSMLIITNIGMIVAG